MAELDHIDPAGARVVLGAGAEARTAPLLEELGATRVLVVAQARHRAGADRIARALGDRCVAVFPGVEPQVPQAVAEAARDLAREHRADWVLSHGGGSAVGVAKAVALEVDVSVAAVPTTYAGSERTDIWGIRADGHKTTGRDPRVRPRLVVYDPQLTYALPRELSQHSLLNALAHSVEALYAVDATRDARAAAARSVGLLIRGFDALSGDPSDPSGRAEALYGAAEAGFALGGASMALQHKLAHVLGGSFGAPHALTHAVLLPYVMAFNLPHSPAACAALAGALGDDPPGALWDRMRAHGVPTRLGAIGGALTRGDLDRVVGLVLDHASYPNPRPLEAAAVSALLLAMWHDRRPSLHTHAVPLPGRRPLAHRGAPLTDARHAVFAVHGRGGSVDALLPDLQARVLRPTPGLAWVGPQAEERSWYPRGFAAPPHEQAPYLDDALATLDEAWAVLTAHVPPERVVVTGFSQGACLLLTWLGTRANTPRAVVSLTGAAIPGMVLDFRALRGVPVALRSATDDPWVPTAALHATADALRAAGALVDLYETPTDQHRIHPADDRVLARTVEQLMTNETFSYQTGFGSALASEARPGALPQRQNSPRSVPYGLFSEQVNGTGFTVERALNRRSWLYRLHPTVSPAEWQRLPHPRFVGRFGEGAASPQIMRFRPVPLPDAPTDFLDGIQTFAGAGDPSSRRGAAVHLYAATADMSRAFANIDGDLLVVPFEGDLRVQTELGWLHLTPGELLVMPRGIRFRVFLPDGASRGWIAEAFDAHLQLPERGPVGANGMADERHFRAPVAAYDDEGPTVIVHKQGGDLWQCTAPHGPFDVVAWHGTYAPFKYHVRDFNSLGSVSFDHPDPSILTLLTCPIDTHGRSALDVAVFVGRWDVAEHTFRPPFFHRNSAVEFNGVVANRPGPWQPGTFSYTPYLSPHAVSASTYDAVTAAPDSVADQPERMSDESIWIQLESTYQLRVLPWFVDADHRDDGYLDSFTGYRRRELT